MNLIRQPLTLLTASLALAATLGANPAEAAILSWSLTFTSGDSVVGAGSFSYDTEQVVVVKEPRPYSDYYIADPDDPIRPDFIPTIPGLWTVTQYPNPIVDFVANLPGQSWTFTTPAWWAPEGPGALLGSFQCGRFGCSTASQWFAGSTSGLSPGQFAMFGGEASADGSYTGTFISAPLTSSPPLFVAGSWKATAVPEPTTIAGAVIFGVGCLLSRRSRSR